MTAPRTVKSYLAGRWVEGEGDGSTLVDPTTEEVLAQTSTRGLDFGAALADARARGGPALRALTFAERGHLLLALSKAIRTHRDELLELSTRNGGTTRGDGKFDIDGATFTLYYYGKLGAALGDVRLLADGEIEQLGRSPRFVGGHVLGPRAGACIQINAFNFPVWGFGEKAACALLAGMPLVVKPSPATALVTERLFEVLIEQAVLPEGALTLISGEPHDLLDHAGAEDVVAFTGSAATGATVRTHPKLVARGVRVNVEADSVNAALVGPDVETGSTTWDRFIRQVATEITQKAGQKCTATRRIFVPEDRLDDARRDLVEMLDAVVVGNPRQREVRMGPLVSAEQLQRVRAGLDRLGAVAEMVRGDGGRGELVGVEGEGGFFVAPVLFQARPNDGAALHTEEVFGPVSTLMPYSGEAADAIALVRRGGGSLVATTYSDDHDFTEELLLGLAPYHGRLYFAGSKLPEDAQGPGAVHPALVHGGPGRAGAGEELGGRRGLELYLQRTAVQGDRRWLGADFGGLTSSGHKPASEDAAE